MPRPWGSGGYPLPEHGQEFESMVEDFLRRHWDVDQVDRHGRNGQRQHGVDFYARVPRLDGWAAGQATIQRDLDLAEVRRYVRSADAFDPQLKQYLLFTSRSRDATLQAGVRRLSDERTRAGRFGVSLVFYEDICRALCRDPATLERHFPDWRTHAPRFRGTILALGGHKGGVGRTAIAQSLAAELAERGYSALLLDGDDWKPGRHWHATGLMRRVERQPNVVALPENVETLSDLAAAYEFLVVDCPSHDDDLLRRVSRVADVVVLPCSGSPIEMWTMERSAAAVAALRPRNPNLRAHVLLSRTDRRSTLDRAARATMKTWTLPVLETELHQSIDYHYACGLGLGVTQFAPDARSGRELSALVDELGLCGHALGDVKRAYAGPERRRSLTAEERRYLRAEWRLIVDVGRRRRA